MKKSKLLIVLFVTLLLAIKCQQTSSTYQNLYLPDNPNIHYTGRIDFSNPQKPKISGAGAYFEVKFKGSACEILFNDQNLDDNHNYQ